MSFYMLIRPIVFTDQLPVGRHLDRRSLKILAVFRQAAENGATCLDDASSGCDRWTTLGDVAVN